ncbi:unnamed protein product [Adineta steineri]|uniref:Uncharacterized protein n=1 Tax=Adineta steineri TaxID=433720 RepID=A0A818JZR1_9BILA|nr:unnamed protein product [Adineta steineri]CAF0777325.1 unnamed protein product [Adineta steineri]CAF0865540.1 unnamed protein product [Adineta steineri]CAF0908342.1 unnamed protein product [Adineta steineri]CAF3548632.1 unnamed protein product [Adineta steineri]
MTMHGTGMDYSTLNHFHRVARAMNHYVATSSHNSSHTGRDGFHVGPPFYPNSGLGNRVAGGLHSIGMPNSFVSLGYRVGQMVDSYL